MKLPTIRKKFKELKIEDKNKSIVLKSKNYQNFEETLTKNYNFYCKIIKNFEWKPDSRESASLTIYNNNAYLIGGLSRIVNDDIACFSFSFFTKF